MKFLYGVFVECKPFGQIFHFEEQGLNGFGKNLNGDPYCHNPSLGLATKARVCKGANQERNLGVTFHAPGSV
jgi:hypothetical protein